MKIQMKLRRNPMSQMKMRTRMRRMMRVKKNPMMIRSLIQTLWSKCKAAGFTLKI